MNTKWKLRVNCFEEWHRLLEPYLKCCKQVILLFLAFPLFLFSSFLPSSSFHLRSVESLPVAVGPSLVPVAKTTIRKETAVALPRLKSEVSWIHQKWSEAGIAGLRSPGVLILSPKYVKSVTVMWPRAQAWEANRLQLTRPSLLSDVY